MLLAFEVVMLGQLRILTRFCLLIAIAIARHVYVMIEQPRSSVMPHFLFFEVFKNQLNGYVTWVRSNLWGPYDTYGVILFCCLGYVNSVNLLNAPSLIATAAESHGHIWIRHRKANNSVWNSADSSGPASSSALWRNYYSIRDYVRGSTYFPSKQSSL